MEVPTDDVAVERFAELEARGGPVVEAVPAFRRASALPPASSPPEPLGLARFGRSVDTAWRRTSYTALTAAEEYVPYAGVGSEPETGEREDESIPPVADGAGPAPDRLLQRPSPMAELPGGTTFGTLVHAVLERVDPAASDLSAELLTHTAEQLARRPVAATAPDLAAALERTVTTPLGPLLGNRTLAQLGRADRLTELGFELPLAGGDRVAGQATGEVTVAALASTIREHPPPDDPLAPYAERLSGPSLGGQPLRGYLTGSLDVVLRGPGPTYVVADYKTNWLGEDAGGTLWPYRPDGLRQVMLASHYPLQAMLYAVALHRFLRWRQPAYDPESHLGGVLYLFVRGMDGPETPVVDRTPCGVFSWRPPASLVEALSAVLDRSAS
jgi:exodeoxyribonuclease V beta subunit